MSGSHCDVHRIIEPCPYCSIQQEEDLENEIKHTIARDVE